MRPLERIYQSPTQLLNKARADKKRLKIALSKWNENDLRGALFDFSVTTYHILDWIKAFRPDLEKAALALLDSAPELGALRDISNASKHIELGGKAYARHAPKIEIASASATGLTDDGVPPFRLKIQLKNGDRLAIECIADDAIGTLERFFEANDVV